MAVAAYASLVSLTNSLDNAQNRVQLHLNHMDLNQIEALKENAYFLLDYVEVHSEMESPEIQGLWRQVTEVAFEADDILDLHMSDQLHRRSGGDTIIAGNSSLFQDIDRVIRRMVTIKREFLSVKEEEVDTEVSIEKLPIVSMQISSPTFSSNTRNIMVGFDKHIEHVMNELINNEDNLDIIPIVGMGGIGKTTLAKSVFKKLDIGNHFDICLWSTVSQQYSIKKILLDLLYDGKSEDSEEEILATLGQNLYKKLFDRRYLIVLDDVWSCTAWYDVKIFFPNDRNGSRVVITTRLSNVASSISSQKPYSIPFLKEVESWNLLRQNIFGGEGSQNSELEKIGREIAKGCHGLPLAIIVIGRLLAKSKMIKEYWEFVARNVTLLGNSGDGENNCLNILTLSYRDLPIYLKPCFLYMRCFPEDSEIDISNLVKLWVAEGLIRLGSDKTLEDIAKGYLNDLVDRNLLFFRGATKDGEIKMCGIHDLLRDLCLRECDKEQFHLSSKVQHWDERRSKYSCCFRCEQRINPYSVWRTLPELVLTIPSIAEIDLYMCVTCTKEYCIKFRLVGMIVEEYEDVYEKFVISTKTRHVSRYTHFKFPSPLHFLWNLQHLVLSRRVDLPCQIWEMPQLRHIQASYGTFLPEPTNTNICSKNLISLKNLQSLGDIEGFPCTKEVIERIPNLKRLKISEKSRSEYSLLNLAKLHKLERLRLLYPSKNIAFPNSLKILFLRNCKFPWKDMTIIGSLPNLEVLKLDSATEGVEWNPTEGEFRQLKRLQIDFSDLAQWRADQIHFPKLEWLELYFMQSLEEIPLSIGDIATLRFIRLSYCTNSAINSAKRIWEDQQSIGNDNLKIYVNDWPILHFIELLRVQDGDSDS